MVHLERSPPQVLSPVVLNPRILAVSSPDVQAQIALAEFIHIYTFEKSMTHYGYRAP